MDNPRRYGRGRKNEESYIIPVMGPTGAGKSYFINKLLGNDMTVVGHSLNSCTTQLQAIEVPEGVIKTYLPHWITPGKPTPKLVIVDTPGFDDTSNDDSEVLRRIADWLKEAHGSNAKIACVIYLHDICLRRVTGATTRNFEVFEKLCGKDAYRSVVLGTTQWSKVPPSECDMAKHREEELLTTFWGDMISKGSKMARVDENSPWNLVATILTSDQDEDAGTYEDNLKAKRVLQIQKEMGDLKWSLPETEAAQVLRRRIEEMIGVLKKGGAGKSEFQALIKEVDALKPSLATRLKRFFGLYLRDV